MENKKWTDADLRTAFEDSCKFINFKDLQDFLLERRQNSDTSESNCNKPLVRNCVAVPEWLTDEIRALANKTWNEHKDTNDGKRVEAMRVVQSGALDAGYTIGIKKAMELLQQHCL